MATKSKSTGKGTGKAAKGTKGTKRSKSTGANEPSKGGIKTEETTIVACQCGNTSFEVKKRTKTAVSLNCMRCGLPVSVKGSIGKIRVKQSELEFAIQHLTGPDPNAEDAGSKGKGKDKGDGEPKRITVFKIPVLTDREQAFRETFDMVRVMHCTDPRYLDKLWMGYALELIFADFRSGVPLEVQEVVADIHEESKKRIAEAGEQLTGRAKTKLHDEVAKKHISKLLQTEMFGDEEVGASTGEEGDGDGDGAGHQDPEEDQPEAGQLVKDGGRLLRSVRGSLQEYEEATDQKCTYLAEQRENSAKVIDHWKKNGGHLLRILGDERTIGNNGFRTEVVAWVSDDDASVAMEFGIEYSDIMDDLLPDANLEVIEVVKDKKKKIASFADKKEVMK